MAAVLLLAFLVVPIAEIYVILQIGHAIGGWQTLGLLIAWSALGAWLVRREGRRAWDALRSAAADGRLPGREVADGALVLAGGVLLLTPGFITDAVGLLLVLPFTRPLARRAVVGWAARRARRAVGPGAPIRVRVRRGPGAPYGDAGAGYRGDGGSRPPQVIEGETVRRDDEAP
ncbi:MAG: FxsA family protein [Frankiaceae bacterium]